MKYALNLAEDNRILSACMVLPRGNYDGMPIVEELPEGNSAEYLSGGGQYVHEPLPKCPTIPVAPRNVTDGEYITVNNVLYKATTNIPNGTAIVAGQNAIETTIEEQLTELAKGE